jgi:hypothetical protein
MGYIVSVSSKLAPLWLLCELDITPSHGPFQLADVPRRCPFPIRSFVEIADDLQQHCTCSGLQQLDPTVHRRPLCSALKYSA